MIEKMIEKITLINPKDDKEISFQVCRLNGVKFHEISNIETKFRDVRKEANLLFMLAQSNPKLLKEQFKNNPDIKQFESILNGIIKGELELNDVISLFESNDSSITKANYERRIEIIKCIIDKSKLSPDELALLEQDEFWLYQDYFYIIDTADFFRKSLRQ
jgi:hypothetical protein